MLVPDVARGLRWGELTRAQASQVAQGMLVEGETKSRWPRRVHLAPDLLTEIQGRLRQAGSVLSTVLKRAQL